MTTPEIGGYFGLEHFTGKDYYPSLLKLNTARNALWYLIIARKIRKLYIPYYLCDAVSDLCNRVGCEYTYYCVGKDFTPKLETITPGAYVYIVNYFGQLTDQQILQYRSKYGNIILDNVQAFFRSPPDGIDTIYSCRKFFGVPDGAYLSTDAVLQAEVPADTSKDRMQHVLGRYEETASAFYAAFKENDEGFYGMPLRKMSGLTENILRAVDYEVVKASREQNYKELASILGSRNSLNLHWSDGPYCYPFYCKNGTEVRALLSSRKIYVPTLWPNALYTEDPVSCDYAANILPLPCDQRYGKEQMQYMANILLATEMNTVITKE